MILETQGKQFQQQENQIEHAKKTIRMQNAALNEIENEYNRIQLSLLKLEDEIEKKEKEICEQFNENSLANVITILQEEYDTLKEDIEHIESQFDLSISEDQLGLKRLEEMESDLIRIRSESQLEEIEKQLDQIENIKQLFRRPNLAYD